jgi:hypothetical protein
LVVKATNKEGKEKLEKSKEDMANAAVTEEENPDEEDQLANDDDPFRPSWQKGQRNKIFTR